MKSPDESAEFFRELLNNYMTISIPQLFNGEKFSSDSMSLRMFSDRLGLPIMDPRFLIKPDLDESDTTVFGGQNPAPPQEV